MSSNSSVTWQKYKNKNTLCAPLITLSDSNMNIKKFNECIKPLEYILYPIGIYNLLGFDDYKPSLLLKIWSYIYSLSLLFICLYTMNPSTDAWMEQVDENSNRAQSIALRVCFIDHQISSISIYIFLRFYFIRKKRLLNLLKSLYDYIVTSCNQIDSEIANNTDGTWQYIEKYYNEIYEYTKMLSYCCYLMQFITAITWTIIASVALSTSNFVSYLTPTLFAFQVYWILFAMIAVSLTVLKILKMYYFVYTSKIYHFHIASKINYDKDMLSIMDLNELQTIFDQQDTLKMHSITKDDDNVNNNNIWNIYDMKRDYIKMMKLWSQNAKYWDYIFIVAAISILFQVLQGFIFFFAVTNWSFFFSALLIWLWGMIALIIYLSQISRINSSCDDLKELIVIIDGDINENDELKLMKFIQFIDIHRCSFEIFGVEWNWNLTYALLVTAASPFFTYIMTYFINIASL